MSSDPHDVGDAITAPTTPGPSRHGQTTSGTVASAGLCSTTPRRQIVICTATTAGDTPDSSRPTKPRHAEHPVPASPGGPARLGSIAVGDGQRQLCRPEGDGDVAGLGDHAAGDRTRGSPRPGQAAHSRRATGRVCLLSWGAWENPDLFWAIRGGGNYGVVTEFEFRLHEVGPAVQAGLLFWGLEHGPSVLRVAREVIAALPRELNMIVAGLNAPPAPFVPEQHHHQPGYALVVAGFGSAGQHSQVMTRIREALPPLWEFTTPMPYVALQQMLDEANAWGFHTYDKETYLEDLSDEAIAVVA